MEFFRSAKRQLLRWAFPNIPDMLGPLPVENIWPFYGGSERYWKVGRYEVINWQFEDALHAAQADLNEREKLFRAHEAAAAKLQADTVFLSDLIELMRSVSHGAGI